MGRDTSFVPSDDEAIVSIHAPAWGATYHKMILNSGYIVFQSTRPHGARLLIIAFIYLIFVVSIHAPAWGATIDDAQALPIRYVSIHAPAWGATKDHAGAIADLRFQSTRPHGARHSADGDNRAFRRFNPRARMGRDCIYANC